ncbi:MAG TPA: outer membrane beta-barrel protein, partial [Pyrinomonadaceae bacterium]
KERTGRSELFWDVTAFSCFVGAFAAGVTGSVLTTTWILNGQLHPWLRGLGLILLILAIPIFVFGGHCLDIGDRKAPEGNEGLQPKQNKHLRARTLVGAVSVLFLASGSMRSQQVTQATRLQTPPSTVSSSAKWETEQLLIQPIGELEKRLGVRDSNASARKVLRPDFIGASIVEARDKGVRSEEQDAQQQDPKWQYGGFVDLAYPLNFNHPANRLFRSRGTAFRTDSVWLNMAAFYVRKKATEESHWGVELTAQGGKDAQFFGFSATAPNIAGYKFLRQLGPTNVSYLAPVGKGLTLQAGIFSSLIGYDSLYAKDNLNYTRPWGADFTPYFMMGANASYPFTEKLTGTFFLVNGYWHLARANSAPSAGGQIAYKVTPRVTVKETTLFGPHQRNTSFEFWRFLTDTIVERKTPKFTFASEYIFSTERVDAPAKPRALMMAWQLPTRWTLNNRWSLSFRPEVFWDRDGRWTLARQTVKAFTSTLEYRVPYRWTNTIFRLEHRFDDSRGADGGFFRGRELSPGVVGLTPHQHLLILATIFTFDSPAPN